MSGPASSRALRRPMEIAAPMHRKYHLREGVVPVAGINRGLKLNTDHAPVVVDLDLVARAQEETSLMEAR